MGEEGGEDGCLPHRKGGAGKEERMGAEEEESAEGGGWLLCFLHPNELIQLLVCVISTLRKELKERKKQWVCGRKRE